MWNEKEHLMGGHSVSNIDRLSERLDKKYRNKILTLKIMRKVRDDLIQLRNRLADVIEVSDNRIEIRKDNNQNEVLYFKLMSSPAEFRTVISEGKAYLQVRDPETQLVHVVLQINSSEELLPLVSINNPCSYSIHISELVDFIIGVVCFSNDFENGPVVAQ
ncbi:hypothetical protein [Bacillus velezensis]|uniref:hypothetical protein n=1 Tax=Bacillus velezensis TaxID=492670 RepID=UPI003F6E1E21